MKINCSYIRYLLIIIVIVSVMQLVACFPHKNFGKSDGDMTYFVKDLGRISSANIPGYEGKYDYIYDDGAYYYGYEKKFGTTERLDYEDQEDNETGYEDTGESSEEYSPGESIDETHCVSIDGKKVEFVHQADTQGYFYRYSDEKKLHRINCLDNILYTWGNIFKENLYTANGKIYGLINISLDNTCTYFVGGISSHEPLDQNYLSRDLVFELDPESGKNKLIFDTMDSYTRVAGVRENVLFLLYKGTIYKVPFDRLPTGEKKNSQMNYEKFAKLPFFNEGDEYTKYTLYYFDWEEDELYIIADGSSKGLYITNVEYKGNDDGTK